MDRDTVLKYFKASTEYFAIQEEQNDRNKEKSKEILDDLLYAHSIACGLLHNTLNEFILNPGKTNQRISNILALIAAFYQSINLCEDSIKTAYYFNAAAMVRQEYELICEINEIKSDQRKDGKVPNAKRGLNNFGAIYGDLSVLTHLSKSEDVLSILQGDSQKSENINPITLIPLIDENFCKVLYGCHIFLITEIVKLAADLYNEMYGKTLSHDEEFQELIGLVLKTLYDNGLLKTE